jgi:hypothetical protein
LSLAVRDEQKLNVFENRALMKVFGPRRKKVIGDRRKLHTAEIHDLHSPPNIISMNTEGTRNGLDKRNMRGEDKCS